MSLLCCVDTVLYNAGTKIVFVVLQRIPDVPVLCIKGSIQLCCLPGSV